MSELESSGKLVEIWHTGNRRKTRNGPAPSCPDRRNMPNTGERREIAKRVNAKEAETVRQSKKLVSTTKRILARTDAKTLSVIDQKPKLLLGSVPEYHR